MCCLATPNRPKRSITTEIASWPAITTAVSPLAPSVRTAIERDGHVDGAEQATDERPPRHPARRARGCRARREERRQRQQRDRADEERERRRLDAPDALSQARVDRRLHAHQAARADAEQHRQPRLMHAPSAATRSLGLQPVAPDADVDGERRVAVPHPHISRSTARARRPASAGRPFEQQLVVDRQQQARLQPDSAERVDGCGPSRA